MNLYFCCAVTAGRALCCLDSTYQSEAFPVGESMSVLGLFSWRRNWADSSSLFFLLLLLFLFYSLFFFFCAGEENTPCSFAGVRRERNSQKMSKLTVRNSQKGQVPLELVHLIEVRVQQCITTINKVHFPLQLHNQTCLQISQQHL